MTGAADRDAGNSPVPHLGHRSVSGVVAAPQALQNAQPDTGLAPHVGQN
jgi:hypothetical protein